MSTIHVLTNLNHKFPDIKLIRPWPHRSPYILTEVIREIIQDKFVCDIGCAEGDQLRLFSKYAKQVIGIEYDINRAKHAISDGFEIIIGKYQTVDLPNADVFFSWISPQTDKEVVDYIKQNRKKACTVLNFSRKGNHVKDIADKHRGKLLEFEFHEPISEVASFETDGFGWISVVDA